MSINSISFNQDFSYLTVATVNGFYQYSTDPFTKLYECLCGNIRYAEMLFSTSLMAVAISPRLLRIQNIKRQSTLCDLRFQSRILGVKMNRKCLIVILENSIHIHDLSNMKLTQKIQTSSNMNAVCALSPSSENNLLIYPLPSPPIYSTSSTSSHTTSSISSYSSSAYIGRLVVFHANHNRVLTTFKAHNSPVSFVSLNPEATLVATSSEKGTLIRVFSLPSTQNLYQFRRGSIPARIHSITFNFTSSLLCVASATDTVHIFRLLRSSSTTPSASSYSLTSSNVPSSPSSHTFHSIPSKPTSSLYTLLRSASSAVTSGISSSLSNYFPITGLTEMWEPQRDFAWVKIPPSPSSPPLSFNISTPKLHPPTLSPMATPTTPTNHSSEYTSIPSSTLSFPIKTIVAMRNTSPQLMVASTHGSFYLFSIDLEHGGEGVLQQEGSFIT